FPPGGVPYFQRASSCSISTPQSLWLKGGLARMKSAFKSGWASFKKEPSEFHTTNLELILRMARFILESFQVVWLLSCPYTVMSFIFPLCSVTNFSLITNIPPEPQAGSYTRPL